MRRAAAGLALLLFGAAALGAQDWTPWYVRQLQPPIRGDAFRLPRAVSADPHAREIFVCDTHGNRVMIFDERGLFKHQITGGSNFRGPRDLAVDPEGYILLLANRANASDVLLLDFDGLFIDSVDLSGLAVDTTTRPFLASIALSPAGDRIYLTDRANKRLWILDRSGKVQRSIDFTEGLSEEEIEDLIVGRVDVYGDRVLMTVPTDGRVYVFDLDGERLASVGLKGTAPCQTAFPVAAALEDDGTMLILDKQRALFMRWDPVANKCLSQHSGFGNAPGALYQPDDLALDRKGQLYISQGFEGRVQIYAPPGPRIRIRVLWEVEPPRP